MTTRVPQSVRRDDLLTALEPLLDLLGVTAGEVPLEGFRIGGDRIDFTVIVRRADDASPTPVGVRVETHPQEFGEMVYHCRVEVEA